MGEHGLSVMFGASMEASYRVFEFLNWDEIASGGFPLSFAVQRGSAGTNKRSSFRPRFL